MKTAERSDPGCVWCGDAECEAACGRCGKCLECARTIIDGECEECYGKE